MIQAQMRTIINWFNNHSRARDLFLERQDDKGLVLIRPVMTRWTSHSAAATRLVQLSVPVQSLILEKKGELLSGIGANKSSQETAKVVFSIIQNPQFWEHLEDLADLLQPLAVAALSFQANTTRMDTILLMFGKIFTQYRSWASGIPSAIQESTCNAVMHSLESQ